MDKSKFKNILLIIIIASLCFTVYHGHYLSKQIHERDDVIRRMNDIEFNRGSKVDTLINEAEKNLKFYIGGEKASIDQFLIYTNNLQTEITNLRDSLDYYKTYYNMTFDKVKDKYFVTHYKDSIRYSYIGNKVDLDFAKAKMDTASSIIDNANEKLDYLTKEIIQNRDSISKLRTYIDIYKKGFTRYEITLKFINEDKKSVEYRIFAPKLDSALRIYPYYKDKLSYDKEKKEWMIEIIK